MKAGNLEGSPQEIRELIESSGSRIEDFVVFEKPEAPFSSTWILLPVLIVVVTAIILVLSVDVSPQVRMLAFLFGGGGACWAAASVQIRHKNLWATAIAGIGLFLLILVAAGYLGPKDVLDAIKVLKSGKS